MVSYTEKTLQVRVIILHELYSFRNKRNGRLLNTTYVAIQRQKSAADPSGKQIHTTPIFE